MSAAHDFVTGALRRLDPERAHELALFGLRAGFGPAATVPQDDSLATTLGGLALSNPIGLAAGFDKDAQAPDAMLRAGFGFVECGTVTPVPQPGNPRPRLFRLAHDRAVINRLGFNNRGLDAFARSLRARPRRGVVGANIGANKDSSDRVADYVLGLERLWGLTDYFTINVSSPNTPGLRDLQGGAALAELLGRMAETRRRLDPERRIPIFLKVAPDLEEDEIERIVKAAVDYGLMGLVVSNTTVRRPDSLCDPHRGEPGGLSGAPLMGPSTQLLRLFHAAAGGRLTLVGVGGVRSGADAYAKIRAGARAVQLYTALVFEGPGLVSRIRRDLAARLAADGFSHVAEAVGAQ